MVLTVDLFEAIERRVSIRTYKGDPLRGGDLEKILDAAILAPSAGNLQPWCFIVTKGRGLKEALADAALGQSFIAEAAVVITVCAVGAQSAARYGARGGSLYCIQDTAAAVENILLAATALGYGGCWIGAFDESSVVKVLGIPQGLRPVTIIPLGVPGEDAVRPKRKALNSVVHHETYSGSMRPRKQPAQSL